MPCYDSRDNERVEYRDRMHNGLLGVELEAVCCALIRANGGDRALDTIDWKECGVTRAKVQKWWTKHQAEDERRKVYERKQAERKATAASALKKLTYEERKALGLS